MVGESHSPTNTIEAPIHALFITATWTKVILNGRSRDQSLAQEERASVNDDVRKAHEERVDLEAGEFF
jgi:flagellar biosynthesis regulator FlaF